MFDTNIWRLWQVEVIFTNTKDAGQSVNVSFVVPTGGLMFLLGGTIGPDDYAAGRNISASVKTENETVIRTLFEASVSADNIQVPFPHESAAVPNTKEPVINRNNTMLGGGDILRITGASLADNETVTITFNALVTAKPSISSQAEVTLTETIHRLV